MMLVYALWALQLVVSAALLANVATSSQKKFDMLRKVFLCDPLDKEDKGYKYSQLHRGVVI